MFYHVYVLQSEKSKRLYFGYTSDLKKRLATHNNGTVTSTSSDRPWICVYCESYRSKDDARDREQKLKQYGNARTYVKKRMTRSLL